jgi:hypothetical protein
MRYKVPQNVQREDQILWFLTIRQVIMLVVGFGISYSMFNHFNKYYVLYEFQQVLIWIPAGIAAAFAFVRIKGLSLLKFIFLIIEQSFFRPSRRYWQQLGGSPFVSMTQPFSYQVKKKQKAAPPPKKITPDRIKNLAAILDGKSA